MNLDDRRFERYQRKRSVVAEGVRRVVLVACTRARTRFTTDDRPEGIDSRFVTGEESSGCV